MQKQNKSASKKNKITQNLDELEEGWAFLTEDQGINFYAQAIHEEKGWPMEACLEIAREKSRRIQVTRKEIEATIKSETDSMTGFFNKRRFEVQLKREIARSLRHGHTISVIILDMDRFKLINDNLGHLVGDEAIKILGKLIQESIRDEDYAARFGGDEFSIILIDTEEGKMVAERLREKVQNDFSKLLYKAIEDKFPETLSKINNKNKSGEHKDFFNEVVKGTISVGLTTLVGTNEQKSSPSEMMGYADKAQYLAKESGRNMVGVHEANELHLYNKREQLDRLKTKLATARHKLGSAQEELEDDIELLEMAKSERVKKRQNDRIMNSKNRIEDLQEEISFLDNKISHLNEQIQKEQEKKTAVSSAA